MSFYYVLEELVLQVGIGEVVNVSANPILRRGDFLEVRTQVWVVVGVTEKQQVAREFLRENEKNKRVRFLKG